MDLPIASEPGFRVVVGNNQFFYPTMSVPYGKKVFVCPKCGKVWARQYNDQPISWSTVVHTCPDCPGDVLTVPGSFWFLWEKYLPLHLTRELLIRELALWIATMEKDNGRIY